MATELQVFVLVRVTVNTICMSFTCTNNLYPIQITDTRTLTHTRVNVNAASTFYSPSAVK